MVFNGLTFSNEAIAGLFIQGLIMTLVPIILVISWKKSTHDKIFPVLIGAVTWLVFSVFLEMIPTYFLLSGKTELSQNLSENIWLTTGISSAIEGLLEETGRFLAFTTVLKKYTLRRSSLTYGIGHGGFECICFGACELFFAIVGLITNAGMMDQFMVGADAAISDMLLKQMLTRSNMKLYVCLLGVIEHITGIIMHMSFSVFVFAAARVKKYFYLYPVTILLHTAVNFSVVFYSVGIVPLWIIELALMGFAAAMMIFSMMIYNKLEDEEKKQEEIHQAQ